MSEKYELVKSYLRELELNITHEDEADAQQCPADAHDGLISMDA